MFHLENILYDLQNNVSLIILGLLITTASFILKTKEIINWIQKLGMESDYYKLNTDLMINTLITHETKYIFKDFIVKEGSKDFFYFLCKIYNFHNSFNSTSKYVKIYLIEYIDYVKILNQMRKFIGFYKEKNGIRFAFYFSIDNKSSAIVELLKKEIKDQNIHGLLFLNLNEKPNWVDYV